MRIATAIRDIYLPPQTRPVRHSDGRVLRSRYVTTVYGADTVDLEPSSRLIEFGRELGLHYVPSTIGTHDRTKERRVGKMTRRGVVTACLLFLIAGTMS